MKNKNIQPNPKVTTNQILLHHFVFLHCNLFSSRWNETKINSKTTLQQEKNKEGLNKEKINFFFE